ncbi:MAG: DsrE family protein [Nitrospinae bacterium]|nr:DsrE family protein [Nitrospinota bacterium]
MKNVLVVVSSAPSPAVSEKLRMAVGLTLEDGNNVSVLMIDDGVYAGLGHDRSKTGVEIDKHLAMLELMKKDIYAHQPSCGQRNVKLSRFGVKLVDGEGLKDLLSAAGAILT